MFYPKSNLNCSRSDMLIWQFSSFMTSGLLHLDSLHSSRWWKTCWNGGGCGAVSGRDELWFVKCNDFGFSFPNDLWKSKWQGDVIGFWFPHDKDSYTYNGDAKGWDVARRQMLSKKISTICVVILCFIRENFEFVKLSLSTLFLWERADTIITLYHTTTSPQETF